MLSDRGILRVLGIAVAVVIAAPSVAEAGRRYRVTIDSEPAGATLYLNDEDSEPIGTTPFKDKLEGGVYTLILKKDGYATRFDQIRVKKRGKNKVSFRLERLETAKLEVIAPDGLEDRLEGADVMVDGESVGTLPVTHEVTAGAHSVAVEKKGFESFEDYIEVEGGQTETVTADLSPLGGENKDPFAEGGGKSNKLTKKSKPRIGGPPPIVVLGAGLEFGGRVFRYAGADSCGPCRTYDAHGVARFRITAEVYPLVFLDNPLLDGAGITGRFGRAAPLQSETKMDAVQVNTTWTDFDVGVRYQYAVSKDLSAGGGIGFGREEFTFDTSSALFAEVPVVLYQFVRLSADGRMRVHEYASAFAGLHYMLVSDVGELGSRFDDSSARGFGARAGGIGHIIPGFDVRVEAVYNQFSHQFAPSVEYDATGGTDRFWSVLFGGAYSY